MTTRTELPTTEEPRAERCETCRFWEAFTDQGAEERPRGDCRRMPPTLAYGMLIDQSMNVAGDYDGFWPSTQGTEWCGEWCGEKPKK